MCCLAHYATQYVALTLRLHMQVRTGWRVVEMHSSMPPGHTPSSTIQGTIPYHLPIQSNTINRPTQGLTADYPNLLRGHLSTPHTHTTQYSPPHSSNLRADLSISRNHSKTIRSRHSSQYTQHVLHSTTSPQVVRVRREADQMNN